MKEKFNEAKYARNIFKLNPIRKSEETYYAGKTGRNPHGISDNIWKKEYSKAKKKGYLMID